MIKTLLITSVVAAILAGYFFVHTVDYVVYSVRSDERIDELLKLPSVRDKFEENAVDNKRNTGESQDSPLVKQAKKFALYLNPNKPPVQRASIGPKTSNISSRLSVTPKFKVFATSYCAEHPELSLALIDEPGKGRYWVRQSSMIGHLLVEQIKDGLVVVKSSKKTFEQEIEQKPATRSLNRTSLASSLRSSKNTVKSTLSASGRTATGLRRTTNISQKLQRNGNNDENMGELVNDLKDLKRNSASDKTNSGLDEEERSARIAELISKFKSIRDRDRVSAEEAKKLGNIGEEELKSIRKDTNPSSPEADKGKGKVSPPKPDTLEEE